MGTHSVRVIGTNKPVELPQSARLLDALLRLRMPILMACGGKGLCATCHVYVESGTESLSSPTPREQSSLRMLANRKSCSRLSCQAKVNGPDVVISVPEGRYFESSKDIEILIGRRTEVDILHPVTGALLIAAGMLISRSRISQLAQVTIDIDELRARSESIQ
ncbi:MAG: 2Fe-2S iron-sulfur cluster binding domain-containing protein [Myxococcales bacterium]|nr:2Fe-2S iron-sulfur cluster binding domain-containing protein [Myxococcales bacterium]